MLGFRMFDKGIHFTEAGEVIKGVNVQSSDFESIRGRPIRACFRFRRKEKPDGVHYVGLIYPGAQALILIALVIFAGVIVRWTAGELFGYFLYFAVFCVFMYDYLKLCIEAKRYFDVFFR